MSSVYDALFEAFDNLTRTDQNFRDRRYIPNLTGGSARFDNWNQAEQGILDERPDIRLKLPPKFAALIDHLRKGDDDAARWIAFALLGLSQESVSKIEDNIDCLRANALPDGRPLRFTFKDGDLAISLKGIK